MRLIAVINWAVGFCRVPRGLASRDLAVIGCMDGSAFMER